MNYILIVTYRDLPLGLNNPIPLGFPSAFHRALHVIALSPQPVELRFEDK